MAERLSAGIFIEERESGSTAIQAVSTSTFATAGFTLKGRTSEPILVTGLEDFFNKFGGFTNKSLLPTAVTAFYSNGGTRAFIVREVAGDAVKATGDIATNFRGTAIAEGEFYNRQRMVLTGDENTMTKNASSGVAPAKKLSKNSVFKNPVSRPLILLNNPAPIVSNTKS